MIILICCYCKSENCYPETSINVYTVKLHFPSSSVRIQKSEIKW